MRGRSQQCWVPVPWSHMPKETLITARPSCLEREQSVCVSLQQIAVLDLLFQVSD